MGWYQLVFRIVFARWPTQAEAETLMKSAQQQQPNNNASQFRNVLSLFDQKNYTTAFTVRMTDQDINVVEYAGVKVAVDKAEPVIGLFIEQARYEPHMVGFFQKLLRPKMTVIDVGANIGLFSLLVAKLVGKEGHVYSVEPRGENARLLLYSASINGFENISLLATAVGDTTGYTLYQTHIGAKYGTVVRFQLKPGMETKMKMLQEEYQTLENIGVVGEFIYRMDSNPNEYYMAVIFESEEAYKRNAASPEQDARYRKWRELLVADPEWHDGKVIHSHTETPVR